MGNGGFDCCALCGHNEAVRRFGGIIEQDRSDVDQVKTWYAVCACNLRSAKIYHAMGTYCANFAPYKRKITPSAISGPIYSLGHSEKGVTYPRLPWHGKYPPVFRDVTGLCDICQRDIERGVAINSAGGGVMQFCCNSHYMRWWFLQHPDEPLPYTYRQLADPDGNPHP